MTTAMVGAYKLTDMTYFTRRLLTRATALSTATVITLAAGITGAAAQGSDSIPGISWPPPAGAPATTDSDPFYLPPDSLPDTPGEVIRTQDAPQLLDLAGTDGPGSAEKILYTSTTEDGDRVAASGVVLKASGTWHGKGPAPTLVYSPGTRGSGDICAPSRSSYQLFGVDTGNGAVNLNYEYPFHAAASALGMNVVVVDLIGLGTPGQHTYVNNPEQGQATLDAARAGLSQLGLPSDSPVGFFGYSQGGGSAASAAEMASSYAPELNVKGTFAGAPPADLLEVVDAVDRHAITGVLGYALNGAMERHPELASLQDEYFNDRGKEFLADTKDRCIGDSVVRWGLTDTRTMTKDGRSFGEIARDDERLRSVLESYKLASAYTDLNAPLMIANGKNDDTIPWGQARETAARYCEAGGTVQFVTDPLPSILPKSAINHAVPMLTNAGPAMSYMVDRFNDRPAPSNCGRF
nr:lipase family protein [Corynebacterium glyciniphilum]